MSDTATRRRAAGAARRNGSGPDGRRGRRTPADSEPRAPARRRARRDRRAGVALGRGLGAGAGSAGGPRRARPRLHPRQPARPVDARELLLPRRGARPDTHPGRGTGAAGRQPLGWQHDGGHHTSSRSRSPPTSASSGASTSWPTTWCCRCRDWASCASTARSPPPRNAPEALDCGAALLVYPAATTRCTGRAGSRRGSTSAAARASSACARARRADRAGRRDRRAGDGAVPDRGERLARLLRLDKLFRLKVLPISIALPWGLNVGDMLGTFRCRRRSRSRCSNRSTCGRSSATSPT